MARRKYQPNEQQRTLVKKSAGCGLRHEDICAMVGLRSPKTLRRHFHRELAMGRVEATTKVKQTAFRLAISGRDPRMTIFWLKTRARWAPQRTESDPIIETFVIEDYEPPGVADRNGD